MEDTREACERVSELHSEAMKRWEEETDKRGSEQGAGTVPVTAPRYLQKGLGAYSKPRILSS